MKDMKFLGSVLLVVMVLYAVYYYTSNKNTQMMPQMMQENFGLNQENTLESQLEKEQESDPLSMLNPNSAARNAAPVSNQLNPDELLPKDESSAWAQVNPCGSSSLKNMNFLQSGFNLGINTVGNSRKNPNYGLRSEPVIEQKVVSPWLQSTITPDTMRKQFDIGGC